MHRMLLNKALIELELRPAGPVLVKAGEAAAAANPSLPDMQFVRTRRNGEPTVYFPGSSLKGALRSHCERIGRTFAFAGGLRETHVACDPVNEGKCCAQAILKPGKGHDGGKETEMYQVPASVKYRMSCFVCQLFGNTTLAGHIIFDDAYPDGKVTLEERNGVAIDRVFGSVRQGPFQYETLVAGKFSTTIRLSNFTCAHLGLLLIALRDLAEQHLLVGFGKSRGLGRLHADLKRLTLSSRSPEADETTFPGIALDLSTLDPGYLPADGEDKAWVSPGDDLALLSGGETAVDDLDGRTWVLKTPNDINVARTSFTDAWLAAFGTKGKGG